MLTYPQIDPVALAIGPLKIHWYGLMYLIGIGGAWWLAKRRLADFDPDLEQGDPVRPGVLGGAWGDRRGGWAMCCSTICRPISAIRC